MGQGQVEQALSQLIKQALDLTAEGFFETEFDPAWRSHCEIDCTDKQSRWKPVRQQNPVNFTGLSNALNADIHPDIKEFYGSYWSGCLQTRSVEGPVSLIQLWNAADFDRLIENLIGHLMMKQNSKQPFTVFFANTDPDSELFLSIENSTGRILLEEPGQPPLKEVDSNLSDFLNRLSADKITPGIF